jgi:hypothetical protein
VKGCKTVGDYYPIRADRSRGYFGKYYLAFWQAPQIELPASAGVDPADSVPRCATIGGQAKSSLSTLRLKNGSSSPHHSPQRSQLRL